MLTQITTFPETPTTTLRWSLKRPTSATLKLRHPHWSETAVVLVNGVETARSTVPGSYVDVARTWQDGDRVDLRLAMEVAAQRAPAAPDIVAFTYGPLVLAGALGRDGLAPGSDIIVSERKYGAYNDTPFAAPNLAGDPDTLAATLKPGSAPLEFTTLSAEGMPIRLVPYHQIAHERHATYWKVTRSAV